MIDRPATDDDRPVTDDRPADLVLARLHLRLGSLTLARAELETLAGRDGLDADGLVDLAEVRWRTGDIIGAGEAAVGALHDEDGPLLALVVAAEAAAARGRPTEARRLADRALAIADGSIDGVFAGMPRGPAWPPDASAPPPAPTTMFDPPQRAVSGASASSARRPAAAVAPSLEDQGYVADVEQPIDTSTLRMWDDADRAEALNQADTEIQTGSPTGEDALDLGRAALESGDLDDAIVRLSLVLRASPALAPAVIDLVADRPERAFALIRGDAYRLVGRELEALRAYADAARPITDRADRPDPDLGADQPPQGDPA